MSEPRMTHEQAIDLAPGYVLGALERDEEAAVRDHLATCALPHPDFEALGGVVPALLKPNDLVLVEPPVSLGVRIMAAAAADLAANPRSAAVSSAPAAAAVPPAVPAAVPAAPAAGAMPEPVAPTTGPATAPMPTAFPSAAERATREEVRRARTSRFDWALRIAAVLAIVVSGAYALNVQGQLDRARVFDQAVAAVVQAGQRPGATTVVLAQQKDQHGSGIAAVSADGSVVLAMRDLQATSGTQSYTAWVIVGSNAPVNVGDFTVDTSGTRAFTTRAASTPAGAIVAVTLEANPGNPAPKGPIVSAGQVPSPPPASS